MNILVVGNSNSQAEFSLKFGSRHLVNFKSSADLSDQELKNVDLVFDFEIFGGSKHGEIYHQNTHAVLFLNSVMTTVSELVNIFQWKNKVIGFNGMSGLFNKPMLEVTTDRQSPAIIEEICSDLGTEYRLVEDKIGMITPRVLCMIINEAYYTVEEGTAHRTDVDLAMKLGTNYPYGPFEIVEILGIKQVFELLEALYLNTGDERYKVCQLLKSECAGS